MNSSNNNNEIMDEFQIKLVKYLSVLATCKLSPSNIIERYMNFWQPLIKFIASDLTLNPGDNIL